MAARVEGEQLLNELTNQLVAVGHLEKRIDRDRTSMDVVRCVEEALRCLDDAHAVLAARLAGLT